MRVNYCENIKPRHQVLSEDQIEEILSGSLEVLERAGVKIHDEKAVELLKDSGAQTIDGLLVKIPSFMVKRALLTAPGRIVLAQVGMVRGMWFSKRTGSILEPALTVLFLWIPTLEL